MNTPTNFDHLTTGLGWAALTDPSRHLGAILPLLAAAGSGALLAYHPVYRGRPITLGILEQRKTLIIYATVGALIAIICSVAPSMAFVIFGIGGLMRFRTDTGESTTTGHTIMATLIGLSWGLGLHLVAVLATLYFWVMIYALEAAPVKKVTVDIAGDQMARSAFAYRQALQRVGCRVLGHSKNFKKCQMSFVIRAPRDLDTQEVWSSVNAIPEELRGALDWPD